MDYAFIDTGFSDISPVLTGYEKCASHHRFGPAMRDYYLVHFVLSGRGSFTDVRGTHTVRSGELFLIRPGEVTVYEADEKEPWEYVWLGFLGSCAERFSNAPSTAQTPAQLDVRLRTLVKGGVFATEIYVAIIYELMYHLSCTDAEDSSTDRLRRVHRYIRYNYMRSLSVGELAHTFGFERSYLFRIFKERYGVGIKEYITRVRMTRAAELIDDGYRVGEVAAMVGYDDPFNFSKAFKSYYGVSPSSYRTKQGKLHDLWSFPCLSSKNRL